MWDKSILKFSAESPRELLKIPIDIKNEEWWAFLEVLGDLSWQFHWIWRKSTQYLPQFEMQAVQLLMLVGFHGAKCPYEKWRHWQKCTDVTDSGGEKGWNPCARCGDFKQEAGKISTVDVRPLWSWKQSRKVGSWLLPGMMHIQSSRPWSLTRVWV